MTVLRNRLEPRCRDIGECRDIVGLSKAVKFDTVSFRQDLVVIIVFESAKFFRYTQEWC